jgi:FlaA1/EpsC-like NDP-sugar epimerase
MRFDFARANEWSGDELKFLPLVVVVALSAGFSAHLYGGRFRIGTSDEVGTLLLADVAATVAVFALNFAVGRPVPASVPIGAGVLALMLSAGARLVWRRRREGRRRPNTDGAVRVLVMGAGGAGEGIVKQLLLRPDSPYLPVAFLDDDPMKRHLRLSGVPVLGGRHDLAQVAKTVDAGALLFAIPSASTQLVREMSQLAADVGLPVRVLPTVQEVLDGRLSIADIRPLAEHELLGRPPVHIDTAAVAAFVRGKRMLVTGAGGSIGAELCRQLALLGPEKLVMLDRDESGLYTTQLAISGRALLYSDDVVVADVRDAARIREVMADVRPQVVFHAAALKHLPLLELYPGEAVKTNVTGTKNVLNAALEHGVQSFVNVSTDKAADPVSVLGFTKRITERLTAWAAGQAAGPFVSVRFGNVLGSRGSLLTTFQAQIAAGLPVTVTHPDVTRYFMTVEEAVQLVLQASVIGRPGEVLVLDMGEPVSIRRLAEQLVADSPGAPEIVITGLRRGEKLHEALLAAGERDERPFHPSVSHVVPPPLHPRTLQALDGLSDGETVVMLAALAQYPHADVDLDGLTDEPAYLVVDHHGLVSSADVSARRLLRTRHEEIVGRPIAQLAKDALHADGSPLRWNQHPGEVIRATGQPIDDAVIGFRPADGRCVWMSVSARPVLGGDSAASIVMFLREIAWDPDPRLPEVIEAMARTERLRAQSSPA